MVVIVMKYGGPITPSDWEQQFIQFLTDNAPNKSYSLPHVLLHDRRAKIPLQVRSLTHEYIVVDNTPKHIVVTTTSGRQIPLQGQIVFNPKLALEGFHVPEYVTCTILKMVLQRAREKFLDEDDWAWVWFNVSPSGINVWPMNEADKQTCTVHDMYGL